MGSSELHFCMGILKGPAPLKKKLICVQIIQKTDKNKSAPVSIDVDKLTTP